MDRKVGDIIVDINGRISLLLEIDALSKSLDLYDRAMALHPFSQLGRPIGLRQDSYRVVGNLKDLLKLAAQNGFDFKTTPEPDDGTNQS